MRRMNRRRLMLTLSVAAALTIASGWMIEGGLAQTSDPKPPPPLTRGSDKDYQQIIDSTHQRDEQFLKDFVAQRRDPRSLQRVAVGAWDPGPATLAESVSLADLIASGRVERTDFAVNPSGGLPVARATVKLEEVVKGTGGDSVTVLQLAGPIANGGPGALEYLETDEPLLPGDEVVLLLRPHHAVPQTMATLPGAGIYFIRNSRAVPELVSRFGQSVAGKSKAELLNLIRREVGR